MYKRWGPDEDKRIARQLAKGTVIAKVRVPGRKERDIRKRAYRIGLLVKHNPIIERRAVQWATIKSDLEAGDRTLKQLATLPGMTADIVKRVLERHSADVHVADWILEASKGRRRAKLWRLGAGEDVPDEINIGVSASHGDPEAAMIAEARERLREVEARGELIRRDPFVVALFGQYRPSALSQVAA